MMGCFAPRFLYQTESHPGPTLPEMQNAGFTCRKTAEVADILIELCVCVCVCVCVNVCVCVCV